MCTAIFTYCPGRGCKTETASPRLKPCSRKNSAFPSATPCIPARKWVLSTTSCPKCPEMPPERSHGRSRSKCFARYLRLPGCQADTTSEEEGEVDDELQLSPPQQSDNLPDEDLQVRKEMRNSSQRQNSELFFNHGVLRRDANMHELRLIDNDYEALPRQLTIPTPPKFLITGAGRKKSSRQTRGKRISNEVLPLQQPTPLRTKRQGMRGPPRSTRSVPLPEDNRQTCESSRATSSRRRSLPPPTDHRHVQHYITPVPALPAREYLLPGPGPQDWEFDEEPFSQIPGHYPFRRHSGSAESAPLQKENSPSSAAPVDLPTSEDANSALRPGPLQIGNRRSAIQPSAQASASASAKPEAQPASGQLNDGDAGRRRSKAYSGITPRLVDIRGPANVPTATPRTGAGPSGVNCKLTTPAGHNRTNDEDCCAVVRSIESIYLNMRYDQWITI